MTAAARCFALLACALLAGCATPFEKRLAEAKRGDSAAQYDVALCYATGSGTGKGGTRGTPDSAEAVRWLEKAAPHSGEASLALGLFHYYHRGVTKDWNNYEDAFRLFRYAAEKRKTPGASLWMGECFLKGRGTDQDLGKAIEWFRKCAAETNTAPAEAAAAMSKIGACYLYGTGVPPSFEESTHWFGMAAKAGDSSAAKMADLLTREYFEKARDSGEAQGADKPSFSIVSWSYDSGESGFSLSAKLRGDDRIAASESLKRSIVAQCENDLLLREPSLERSSVSWDWAGQELREDGTASYRLLWYYVKVVGQGYNANNHSGYLDIDIGRQSYESVRNHVKSHIAAICSTKLVAMSEKREIPEGTLFEILDESFNAENRILHVVFKALN
ncbi:MAG: sel1 repeat family protein [Kiritimatiellae bacterium]|nr:sel1 repeat family protein [Kiritimatiellia bacterium]